MQSPHIMAKSGMKVISLQPVAQDKVMSVKMKKGNKLKGHYEGGIVIAINHVWAEERENKWMTFGLPVWFTGWMVCHLLSCEQQVEEV